MIEGTLVGQYRIVRKLGEGGMGAVFVAEHTMLGRRAAIKMLQPALSANREIVDRFFNEARATTSISDPGIVQVFDFGFHTDGTAFIVMELLEGESLDARLKRFGHLPAADAVRICRQAAAALASAHARGIVHRDLKPENIFLVRDAEAQGGERPKVLDFGIAKLGGGDANRMRTQTGALMGTPVYMSPEQCRGAGFVDHRSDIYSLGCVLFHLLTGRPPFEGEGMGEIIAAHLREPPRPPSAVVPGLPPELDALVLRTLAKNVDERVQSMSELQHALEAAQAQLTAIGAGGARLSVATPLAPGFRSEYPGVGSVQAPVTATGVGADAAGVRPAPAVGGAGAPTAGAAPTTLAGATSVQPAAPRRGKGLLVGLLATAALGAGAAFVLVRGSSDGNDAPASRGTGATPSAAGSGSTTAPAGGPGATTGSGSAAVATPPDAAPAVATPPDAAPAVATPPDASPAVATPPDAVPAKSDPKPRRDRDRKSTTRHDRTSKPVDKPQDADPEEDLYDSR